MNGSSDSIDRDGPPSASANRSSSVADRSSRPVAPVLDRWITRWTIIGPVVDAIGEDDGNGVPAAATPTIGRAAATDAPGRIGVGGLTKRVVERFTEEAMVEWIDGRGLNQAEPGSEAARVLLALLTVPVGPAGEDGVAGDDRRPTITLANPDSSTAAFAVANVGVADPAAVASGIGIDRVAAVSRDEVPRITCKWPGRRA